MANIANDKAMLDELEFGSGDMHSLTAKMAYPDKVGDCPVSEIKSKFKHWRQEAKGVEFCFNYGGNANTLKATKGIPTEEATEIEANYMKGFSGLARYQKIRRHDVMDKGYILINPLIKRRAHIYDYKGFLLPQMAKQGEQGFWLTYRDLKESDPTNKIVMDVKHFFRRKSATEKQSINYPIQGTGADMSKIAMIKLFNWIVSNRYFNIVKIINMVHDECEVECPESLVKEVANEVQRCMEEAGRIFCKKVPVPAEPEISKVWVH